MAEEWKEYVSDPRTVCKYGTKCYQKNPEHHKNFKHPPLNTQRNQNRTKRRFSPYTREKPQNASNSNEDIKLNTDNKDITQSAPVTESISIDQTTEILSESSGSTNSNELTRIMAVNLPENITFYSKTTDRSVIKELFQLEMPDDFYNFYECIHSDSQSFEDTLATVNLLPIGPYELLTGKLPKLENKELYLVHWRFFYDPPEFQAILKKKKNSEYHIGYFRDEPDKKPVFVASNNSEKDYHITLMAENIFGAVYLYLQNEKKQSPFMAIPCQKMMDKIKAYTQEHNISLQEFNMKKRSSQIVTKSFHGAGIVVPYNKKTQLGYRRLVETDANLKKMFENIGKAKNQEEKDKILSELQPVITYASIALDECDFGTGIEVGIALFCSGLKELEPSALSSLTAAYTVLNRTTFGNIVQAHIKYRRKGSDMSLLSLRR